MFRRTRMASAMAALTNSIAARKSERRALFHRILLAPRPLPR